jgi:small subunit ribosomal protein S5
MEDQKPQTNTNSAPAQSAAPIASAAARPAGSVPPSASSPSRDGSQGMRPGMGGRGNFGRGPGGPGGRPGMGGRGPGGGRPGGGRGPGGRPFVKKDEFQEQTLDMRRVARVMAGGKRFRFRATIVIGDLRGRVGVGMGKGIDVQQAIAKAQRDARKRLITVPLAKRTIPHEVEAKFSAARIRLKPAKEGHGLVAGGAARAVLSLAGIKDITAKALGRTPNQVTNALATYEALKQLKARRVTNNKQLITDNKDKKVEEPKTN